MTEIDEISGVVRDQRCPEPARKRGDQQIGVVARSTPAPLIRPESCGILPHRAVIFDPLKRSGKSLQVRQLSSRAAVSQSTPQLVKDNRAHEEIVVTFG